MAKRKVVVSDVDTGSAHGERSSAHRAMQRALLRWFAGAARDLPWRRTRDPYAIWVSEIMLQQTQVDTVRGHFARFLARFPNLEALANADETEVLRHWEGLGYYRRARQLWAAAQRVCELHGGRFPTDLEAVLHLPGIGRYTAGAILSIAFDQRQPILEANTIRVYSRLLGYRGDVRSGVGQRRLWEFAAEILPTHDVGAFNQAMMELGSLICTPRKPDCGQCPLAIHCQARQLHAQAEIPAPAPPKQYTEVAEAAVLVLRRNQVLLRRCGPDERWAGLWDFPRFVLDPQAAEEIAARELTRAIATQTGVSARLGERFTVIKHAVTRYRITLSGYRADYQSGRVRDRENCHWVNATQLSDYPLNVTGRKLSRWAFAGA